MPYGCPLMLFNLDIDQRRCWGQFVFKQVLQVQHCCAGRSYLNTNWPQQRWRLHRMGRRGREEGVGAKASLLYAARHCTI